MNCEHYGCEHEAVRTLAIGNEVFRSFCIAHAKHWMPHSLEFDELEPCMRPTRGRNRLYLYPDGTPTCRTNGCQSIALRAVRIEFAGELLIHWYCSRCIKFQTRVGREVIPIPESSAMIVQLRAEYTRKPVAVPA